MTKSTLLHYNDKVPLRTQFQGFQTRYDAQGNNEPQTLTGRH